MFCQKCGTSVNEGVKYCKNCGYEIIDLTLSETENSSNSDDVQAVNLRGEQQTTTINDQVPTVNNIVKKRPLRPAFFALAIICFFFTFCEFKCGEQKLGSVTGIDLVTGTQLASFNTKKGKESEGEKIPSNIWAIIALSAAVIGIGGIVFKVKTDAIIGSVASVIGLISMIILNLVISSAVSEKGAAIIKAEFKFGYWGAFFAICIAGILSVLLLNQTRKTA